MDLQHVLYENNGIKRQGKLLAVVDMKR